MPVLTHMHALCTVCICKPEHSLCTYLSTSIKPIYTYITIQTNLSNKTNKTHILVYVYTHVYTITCDKVTASNPIFPLCTYVRETSL